MKKMYVFAYLLFEILNSCNTNSTGPGYQFSLFANTPNNELAKADEREDTSEIKQIISDKRFNINLQDSKFGRTLLMLAIGNDKLLSTKALLDVGADISIRDSDDEAAIHEATQFIDFKKNSYQIIELLIQHGADVNAISRGSSANKGYYYVPLCGATADTKCARLLLDNGANPYFKANNEYIVWYKLLLTFYAENIYTARYMIIDKKLHVPYVIVRTSNNKTIDIFTLLDDKNFPLSPLKRKARQDILDYLERIDFPKNGAYISQ